MLGLGGGLGGGGRQGEKGGIRVWHEEVDGSTLGRETKTLSKKMISVGEFQEKGVAEAKEQAKSDT